MPIEIGSEVEGKITGLANYGAFVDLGGEGVGLVHISQVSDSFVSDINKHLKVGDVVKVKVLGVVKDGKFDLSIKMVGKEMQEVQQKKFFKPNNKYGKDKDREKPIPGSFEDKMSMFLKTSEERLLDFKRNLEGKQGVSRRRH